MQHKHEINYVRRDAERRERQTAQKEQAQENLSSWEISLHNFTITTKKIGYFAFNFTL
jgi:hypothetical protein